MSALATDDPDTIGEFRVQIKLGHGGMGRVYLGLSPAGRTVAVKVLHPELARDEDFLLRFEREIATARAVSGIYTAPVVATGLDDRPPWLATAFVPGPSLQQVVREHGPLTEQAAWVLFAGLVEALGAIHDAGVVHRDLKPSNVLLAIDGPRVIDFGISRAADGSTLTATGMVFGSPAYMSPEQAVGKPTGPAADVFALGCLIAYAAGGMAPFGEGNAASVLYRVVHDGPDLTAVPPRLREIIRRCLAKDAAERPPLAVLAPAVRVPGTAVRVPGTEPSLPSSLSELSLPSELSFWPPSLTGLIEDYQASVRDELAVLEQASASPPARTSERTMPDLSATAAADVRPEPAPERSSAARRSGDPGRSGTGPSGDAGRSGGAGWSRDANPHGSAGRPGSAGRSAGAGPPASVRRAAGVMYAGAVYAFVFALFGWLIALIHSGRPLVVWPGHWAVHSLGGLATIGYADCAIQIVLWLWMARACRNRVTWARAACTALFACYSVAVMYALVRHTHDGTDTLGTGLFCITWLIGGMAVEQLWRPQSSAYFEERR